MDPTDAYDAFGGGALGAKITAAAHKATQPPARRRPGPASASAVTTPATATSLLGATMPLQSSRVGAGGVVAEDAGAALGVDRSGGGGAPDGTPLFTPPPAAAPHTIRANGMFYNPPTQVAPFVNDAYVPVDGGSIDAQYRRTEVDVVKQFVDYISSHAKIPTSKLYVETTEYLAWKRELDLKAAHPDEERPEYQRSKPWLFLRAICGPLAADMTEAWECWIRPVLGEYAKHDDVLRHPTLWRGWADMTVAVMDRNAPRGARIYSQKTQQSLVHTNNNNIKAALVQFRRHATGGDAPVAHVGPLF